MTVTLEPITQDNWVACINLNVSEIQQQRHAVAPNVTSLAQAYGEPWWIPLGVYAGNTMVGFVMYGRRPGTAINYILRLMVDALYQGRGYGRAVLAAVIARIREQDSGEIQLDYDHNDPIAVRLYTAAGFRMIEQNEDGVLARLT
jgi:diamine N-acetyltransferase